VLGTEGGDVCVDSVKELSFVTTALVETEQREKDPESGIQSSVEVANLKVFTVDEDVPSAVVAIWNIVESV
jgi:hypothetical protein